MDNQKEQNIILKYKVQAIADYKRYFQEDYLLAENHNRGL